MIIQHFTQIAVLQGVIHAVLTDQHEYVRLLSTKLDRDMNAARNIMIKNLESSEYKLASPSGLVATTSENYIIGTPRYIRLIVVGSFYFVTGYF
jgi:hypothetical protein